MIHYLRRSIHSSPLIEFTYLPCTLLSTGDRAVNVQKSKLINRQMKQKNKNTNVSLKDEFWGPVDGRIVTLLDSHILARAPDAAG